MKLLNSLASFPKLVAISATLLSSTLYISHAQAAPLTNGDFQSGLSSWSATSGVSATASEEALMQDVQFPVSLFQGFDLPTLPFTLEFDLLNELAFIDFSNDPFAFQDVLFATFYATNDIAGFDPNAPSGSPLALFDADHSGELAYAGSLSLSSAKPGWGHFSIEIDPASFAGFQFGLLAFELFDLNGVASDSSFYIDNVQITEVPEPASIALLAFGAGALRFSRRRKVIP